MLSDSNKQLLTTQHSFHKLEDVISNQFEDRWQGGPTKAIRNAAQRIARCEESLKQWKEKAKLAKRKSGQPDVDGINFLRKKFHGDKWFENLRLKLSRAEKEQAASTIKVDRARGEVIVLKKIAEQNTLTEEISELHSGLNTLSIEKDEVLEELLVAKHEFSALVTDPEYGASVTPTAQPLPRKALVRVTTESRVGRGNKFMYTNETVSELFDIVDEFSLADEGSMYRSKLMISFGTFITESEETPSRLLAGAKRISNTTAACEFEAVKQSFDNIDWNVLHWLWFTGDSAASMLAAGELAHDSKIQEFSKQLHASGFSYPLFMPPDVQPFFMVHETQPDILIPAHGPFFIHDACHIPKNGEGKFLRELGAGCNMASGKLTTFKGELFRFSRLHKPSHECRDIMRMLCQEMDMLYKTIPSEINHRLKIATKLAELFDEFREVLAIMLSRFNDAYGGSRWKGDMQPVLDHMKEAVEAWLGDDLLEAEEGELVVQALLTDILLTVFTQVDTASEALTESVAEEPLSGHTVGTGSCVWEHAAGKYLESLATKATGATGRKVQAPRGAFQFALANGYVLGAEDAFQLLCLDFRRGIRANVEYLEERYSFYSDMPWRIHSYFDPVTGVRNLLEDHARIQQMGREEFLTDGWFHLGFWEHPNHQLDIKALVANASGIVHPSGLACVRIPPLKKFGVPGGIADLGPALVNFYHTYLVMACSENMPCERKMGHAKRIGVGGRISEERTFERLSERRVTLDRRLRQEIGSEQYQKRQASAREGMDKDGHVRALMDREQALKDVAMEEARVADARALDTALEQEEAQRVAGIKAIYASKKQLLQRKKDVLKAMDKEKCFQELWARGVRDIVNGRGGTKVGELRDRLLAFIDDNLVIRPSIMDGTASSEGEVEADTPMTDATAELVGVPECAAAQNASIHHTAPSAR
ncbi:hypothetical protein CYMTET_9976 [Cymbomonas tetramitiformis]|uniref:Uncharacterized protein n=1 Tax=Cymbomonas tetramitiformis TaxID=36881 RepID=A0AAE0GQH2_9CHLO|nr:hypothetical protein CYMTET_9976 [Cymbomonas tetramitiformis]